MWLINFVLALNRISDIMALPGLQGYQGDSEISDSEGEMSPQHSMPPVSGVGKAILYYKKKFLICFI